MQRAATLPVWRSIAEVYRFVAGHPRDLIRIGWLPLGLLLLLSLGFGTFRPKPDAGFSELADLGPFLTDWLLGSLSQGVIAVAVLVAWHRLAMRELGEGRAAAVPRGMPGRRELLYFVQMFGLSLLFLVVFAAAALVAAVVLHLGYWLLGGAADPGPFGEDREAAYVVIGYVAVAIGLFPAFYVALRLALALPETAVAERAGRFSQSWTATGGNGLRMAAVTVLSMVPIEILNVGLSYAAQSAYDSAAYYPLVALACIGLLLMMVVLGSALTKCYLLLEPPVSDPQRSQIAQAAPAG